MTTKAYKEYRKEVREEQKDMPLDEVKELMAKRSEHAIDLNNLPGQTHNWVDRGSVMSCEGGMHPAHRAYKRR